jgi:hypothetical protein
LVYFMNIWYILWTFGIVYEHLVYVGMLAILIYIFPFLHVCTKLNLATLYNGRKMADALVFKTSWFSSPTKATHVIFVQIW